MKVPKNYKALADPSLRNSRDIEIVRYPLSRCNQWMLFPPPRDEFRYASGACFENRDFSTATSRERSDRAASNGDFRVSTIPHWRLYFDQNFLAQVACQMRLVRPGLFEGLILKYTRLARKSYAITSDVQVAGYTGGMAGGEPSRENLNRTGLTLI
jgi:hypothetical protein